MKDLYEVLGVDKKATKEQIKKQYRKKAMESHPDKGGDQQKFNELAISYKILSNDDERKRYDNGENVFKKKNTNLEIVLPIILDVIYNTSNIKFYNVLSSARQIISIIKNNECELIIKQLQNNKEKLIEFNKRIKNKKENIIEEMIKNQIEMIELDIKKLEIKKESYEEALKFLEEYSYVTDINDLSNLGTIINDLSNLGTIFTGTV